MTQLTIITISHYDDRDPMPRTQTYERQGPIQVNTQIISWSRECAIDFFNKLQEAKK